MKDLFSNESIRMVGLLVLIGVTGYILATSGSDQFKPTGAVLNSAPVLTSPAVALVRNAPVWSFPAANSATFEEATFANNASSVVVNRNTAFANSVIANAFSSATGTSMWSFTTAQFASTASNVSDAAEKADVGVVIENKTISGVTSTVVHRFSPSSLTGEWEYTFPFSNGSGTPKLSVSENGKIAALVPNSLQPTGANNYLALFNPSSSTPTTYAAIFDRRTVDSIRLSGDGSTLAAVTYGGGGIFGLRIYDVTGTTPVEKHALLDFSFHYPGLPGALSNGASLGSDDCLAISRDGAFVVYGGLLAGGGTGGNSFFYDVKVAERQANGTYTPRVLLTGFTANSRCQAAISDDGSVIAITAGGASVTAPATAVETRAFRRVGTTWANTPTTILSHNLPYAGTTQQGQTYPWQYNMSLSMNDNGSVFAVGLSGDGTWNQRNGTPKVLVFKPAQKSTGPVSEFRSLGAVSDLDVSADGTKLVVSRYTNGHPTAVFGSSASTLEFYNI